MLSDRSLNAAKRRMLVSGGASKKGIQQLKGPLASAQLLILTGALVVQAEANALGSNERGNRSLPEAIVGRLATTCLLLVFDNDNLMTLAEAVRSMLDG
jgi:hypothetical protein